MCVSFYIAAMFTAKFFIPRDYVETSTVKHYILAASYFGDFGV